MSDSRTKLALLFVIATCACTKRDTPTPPPAPAPVPTPTPLAASGSATGACGTAAPPPRGTAYTTLDGRTFSVWGPASYEPGRVYPVVLTFHGWHTNGRDFQKWFKMEDHVEGAAFTVYPDSQGPVWDLTGDKDLTFTAQIIDALSNAYCIDRARVFALGFSYGAKLVHHLGCKRPGLVRAISGGDGSWHQESGCSPVPVLVTHRTRDTDERLAWGKDAAARWAKINGCSDATDEIDAAHGCVAYRGCTAPNTVTFCEDRHFDPKWPNDWNHTIREEYRSLTWTWFKGK